MTEIRYKVDFGPKPVRKARKAPTLAPGASGAAPATTGAEGPREAPSGPPSRQARLLALAYKVERMIDSGELKDYAEAARRLGVSRARMSQVMRMLLMPTGMKMALLTSSGSEMTADV